MTATMPMFPTFLNAGSTWSGTGPNEVFLKNHEAAQRQEVAQTGAAADTLSRLFDLLEDNGEDDYGVIGPTQHAFKSVCNLIRTAQRQMVIRAVGSPSVDSLGGVRVTWKLNDREIRLICPASKANRPYIYQESELRNQAIHGVTPEVLASKLSWLVSGGDSL